MFNISNLNPNIPVELVYKKDTPQERVVVRFPEGLARSPQFSNEDRYLKAAMENIGIRIPTDQRQEYPEFEGDKKRQVIFLNDQSFGKAFYEVHFMTMDPDMFTWRKI